MKPLSPCAATADEPIEALGNDPCAGPDMKTVQPVEVMLGALHQVHDHRAYLAMWQACVRSIGGFATLTISREGEEELRVGLPCDAQLRHRLRWHHYLTEDLNSDPERRELLITSLMAAGRYADNRPADPRSTTRAIREFLRTEGRILIDPDGALSEGGGVPRAFAFGSDEQAADCVRAAKAYYAVRRRWRADRHIKRAVRMLGTPTANGWIVLRGGPGKPQPLERA